MENLSQDNSDLQERVNPLFLGAKPKPLSRREAQTIVRTKIASAKQSLEYSLRIPTRITCFYHEVGKLSEPYKGCEDCSGYTKACIGYREIRLLA